MKLLILLKLLEKKLEPSILRCTLYPTTMCTFIYNYY